MLFYFPDLSNNSIVLTPEESGHIVRVLRLKSGDQIEITDGKGTLARGTISEPNSRKCLVEITSKQNPANQPIPLHIAVSPTKNIDRILWLMEKAVEIGIQKISFPICKHSERKVLNIDKVRLKAISAMKQSKGTYLPEIYELIPFTDFILSTHIEEKKYIAHLENEHTPDLVREIEKDKSYVVLIGPEGDFSNDELELAKQTGFKIVKMGNKRLRTETAALHACSLINGVHYL